MENRGRPICSTQPLDSEFPATTVGGTASKTLTLTNMGMTGLKIRKASLGGKGAFDYTVTNACDGSIASAGSCTITFVHPSAMGRRSAELSFLG